MKQVIIIRKDLHMRQGKAIAQGVHAAIAAIDSVRFPQSAWLDEWEKNGSTKIVVYVNSLDELASLYAEASGKDLPRSLIEDAGKTEFKHPTFTVVAIGPAPDELVDKITGKLPLL